MSPEPGPAATRTGRGVADGLRVPRWCWMAAAILVLLKLVLISHDELIAFGDDDYGYVYGASELHWGIAYSTFHYSRQPLYHLFLAGGEVFGLPGRLWMEAAWVGACLVSLVGLRRLGLRGWLSLLGFGLALFHPWTLMLFNRTLSDGLYGAAMFPFLVGLCVTITRTGWGSMARWGVLTGVLGAVAANTRLESMLVTGALAIAGACLIGMRLAGESGWRRTGLRAAWGLAVPLALTMGMSQSIKWANQQKIGAAVVSDFDLPGFKRLYAALLAVRPTGAEDLRISIPRDVREWAYEHSPTMATLRPLLEEDTKVLGYTRPVRTLTGVSGEYGGWTVWALRVAAWQLRSWPSAGELDAFYAKAAGELEGALREHPAKRRFVLASFVPPDWDGLGRELPGSLRRTMAEMFRASYARVADVELDAKAVARIDAVGLRRPSLVEIKNGHGADITPWQSPGNVARLDRVKSGIGAALAPLTIAACVVVLAAGVCALVSLLPGWRGRVPVRWWVVSAVMLSAIAGRVLLVALLDVTGIGVQMRYLFAAAGPLIVAAVVSLGVLLTLGVSALRRGKTAQTRGV